MTSMKVQDGRTWGRSLCAAVRAKAGSLDDHAQARLLSLGRVQVEFGVPWREGWVATTVAGEGAAISGATLA